MRDGLSLLRPHMLPVLSHAAAHYTSQLENVLQAAMIGSRVPWTDHWELGKPLE
jgi:hypothetical protein